MGANLTHSQKSSYNFYYRKNLLIQWTRTIQTCVVSGWLYIWEGISKVFLRKYGPQY